MDSFPDAYFIRNILHNQRAATPLSVRLFENLSQDCAASVLTSEYPKISRSAAFAGDPLLDGRGFRVGIDWSGTGFGMDRRLFWGLSLSRRFVHFRCQPAHRLNIVINRSVTVRLGSYQRALRGVRFAGVAGTCSRRPCATLDVHGHQRVATHSCQILSLPQKLSKRIVCATANGRRKYLRPYRYSRNWSWGRAE